MSAKFDKRKIKAVTDLVFMMNSRLWLGRFDLLLKERAVVFSISNIIQEELACSEVIERMVDTTVVECDRFLPAFNMLIGTKISPRQVFDSCIMDVEGEA
jgi:hypothetical protein